MNNDNYKSTELRNDLVYSHNLTNLKLISGTKKLFFYAAILIFWLIVSKLYLNFGAKWIVPSISAMWIMGAVTTALVKEQREHTIKETKMAILALLAFLFMYRGVIQLIAPISSEQMGAALNINVPAASGMAILGVLQNILLIVSVMTPIGFLVWCAQKFKIYIGGSTKQEAFRRIKGMRDNNKRL